MIKKLLVPSYTSAFAFAGPRTPYAVMDDSYACALRSARPPIPKPAPAATSWGWILAQALRQRPLAEKLGLLHHADLTVSADFYRAGGWLYLSLDPSDGDYAAQTAAHPELVTSYAARIPALGDVDRPLFAAVLFPVIAEPPPGDYDELYTEAAQYDDGFAKVVHSAQRASADPPGLLGSGFGARPGNGQPGRQEPPGPPAGETGIHLGWDDEQALVWVNRQLADPATERREAPMAVLGYRVDVRRRGGGTWHSLTHVRADLDIAGRSLGRFDGELHVEIRPVQLAGAVEGDYWLPAYFTQWLGRSLIADDTLGLALSGHRAGQPGYEPADDDPVSLHYGQHYEFRIRLTDAAGGGPTLDDTALNPAPAPMAACHFRRYVPPGPVGVAITGAPEITELTLTRPPLAYPAGTCTGLPDAEARLRAEAARIEATQVPGVPAIPDPDVAGVEITVAVQALGDESIVYRSFRPFPDDIDEPLRLPLAWADVANVADLDAAPDGPLTLPRAREVLLTVQAVGREDENLEYFGTQEARLGHPVPIPARGAAHLEADLFVNTPDTERLRGILLAPGQPAAVQRLAAALDLEVAGADGLTLTGGPGQRTVFGCQGQIAHTLAPGSSALTFASRADLTDRWLIALILDLNRDWTWDGLADPALEIRLGRSEEVIGHLRLPRVHSPATNRPDTDRSHTRLVFLDVVETEPTKTSREYRLYPRWRTGESPSGYEVSKIGLDLPIAVPPRLTPRIVSAGMALSPYRHASDYSATEPRLRMLWLQFAEPLDEDGGFAYFARVLAYAPDPVLTGDAPIGSSRLPRPHCRSTPSRSVSSGQNNLTTGPAWVLCSVCCAPTTRHASCCRTLRAWPRTRRSCSASSPTSCEWDT